MRFVKKSTLLVWLVLCVVGGCSQKPEEEVRSAIDEALYYLSKKDPDCQKAIDVLEDIGREDENALYLRTLASAYACRGGFSELQLFDEVDVIDSQDLLTSLSLLSTSAQTMAEQDEFNDLQTAIDLLLYSGDRTTPSAIETEEIFGTRHGSNINLQALYMIIVQLGRFSAWYGNTDPSTGAKGGGTESNSCFFDYEPAALAVATSYGGANACTAGGTGSDSLDYGLVTAAVAQRRLCQGAMLVNNMLDILENTTLSSNDSLGEISSIYDDISPFVSTTALLDPDMPAFIEMLSQADCETAVASDDDLIQLYYASVFEGGLP